MNAPIAILGFTKQIAQSQSLGSSLAFLADSAACGSSATPTPTPRARRTTRRRSVRRPRRLARAASSTRASPATSQCIKAAARRTRASSSTTARRTTTTRRRSRSTRCSRARKSPTASSSRRPNDRDVYFNEYHSRMRPGSHHMLLYIQDQRGHGDRARAARATATQGAMSRNLFGAQTPTLDVDRATRTARPRTTASPSTIPAARSRASCSSTSSTRAPSRSCARPGRTSSTSTSRR